MKTLSQPELLNYEEVAKLLSCTDRHVMNLVERGLCPRPMKLGRLVRFNPEVIQQWISEGCQPVRSSQTA